MDRASCAMFYRALALHRNPEATSWELIPLVCTCGDLLEAAAPRWTFEAGMREAAQEALAVLWHEADEEMTHSQYRHFLS
jgi:hypothetical protein